MWTNRQLAGFTSLVITDVGAWTTVGRESWKAR